MSVIPQDLVKSTLRFTEGTHKYTLDGRSIPGVTTLISQGVPKPALVYWASKLIATHVVEHTDDVVKLVRSKSAFEAIKTLKELPWEQRDAAAAKGTEVHALAEDILHGRPADVPEALVDSVAGLVRLLDDFQIEPLITEVSIANRQWWYAGRLDGVVRFGRGPWAGATALVDFKTNRSGIFGETALQTSAYAHGEFYVDHDGYERPMPAVDYLGAIHITETGSNLYALGDPEAAFAEFKSAQYIAKTADRRKNLIGEPLSV